ncbi:unnamed protein product [Ceratitis capitata]|uniref:(Mediterranean fruit fly) hypothetical protein n=1 Tax=Ceratitis capitata TaxID=7213 RepID=A0A811VEA1_CERCA|nr:unnamed protein product [Ceratitis capitata]
MSGVAINYKGKRNKIGHGRAARPTVGLAELTKLTKVRQQKEGRAGMQLSGMQWGGICKHRLVLQAAPSSGGAAGGRLMRSLAACLFFFLSLSLFTY